MSFLLLLFLFLFFILYFFIFYDFKQFFVCVTCLQKKKTFFFKAIMKRFFFRELLLFSKTPCICHYVVCLSHYTYNYIVLRVINHYREMLQIDLVIINESMRDLCTSIYYPKTKKKLLRISMKYKKIIIFHFFILFVFLFQLNNMKSYSFTHAWT